MKGVYSALQVYYADYKRLPEYNEWYDLLINEADFLPEAFKCPSKKPSGDRIGNYILNKNFDPSWNSDANIVLVFEGESGWNQVGDITQIKPRHFDGCNILFSSGHVKYVKRTDFDKLKWKQ